MTFEGNADTIVWSFGDGEEVQTSKCELNITKRWWHVGDFNLTVTVSNKVSSVKFIVSLKYLLKFVLKCYIAAFLF